MVLRGVDGGTGPDGFYYSGKIPTGSRMKYGSNDKARLKDIAGRSRGPLISIDMVALQNTGVFRDARTGRFVTRGKTGIDQTRAEILAQQLQELMVTERKKTVERPRVSTGRLDKALLDKRNRKVTATTFGVGIPTWLNQAAPYWRAIEQGTTKFVGRPIAGIFGDALTGEYATGSKYGAYPIAGGNLTRIGHGTGGRLIPLGAMKQAGYTFEDAGGGGGIRQNARRIGRPIAPQRFMEHAWKAFNPREAARGLAQNVLFNALLASRGFASG